uniref:Putative secreted protein n=1 Tax=Ixodes ricinus TaxID=34613 RepID=A0A6B0UIC0_IXORI
MQRMMAFGLFMYALVISRMASLVPSAISVVAVLMMPGRSTRTILCSPGPLTVIEMTSLLTVLPPRTLFFIRSSTSRRKSESSVSLVRSNSLELSLNLAMW